MKNRSVAVFTFVDRYSYFLDVWLKYYTSIFEQSQILIIYSKVTDFDLQLYLEQKGYNEITIQNYDHNRDTFVNNRDSFNDTQNILLSCNHVVLYSDIDELIFHPSLNYILQNFNTDYITTKGFEVIQNTIANEKDLHFNFPIMYQRNYGAFSEWYNKPLIVRKPLYWEDGKHNKNTEPIFYENLFLIHLNKADITTLSFLNRQNKLLFKNVLPHNSLVGNDLEEYIKVNFEEKMVEIPSVIKNGLKI